MSYEVVYTDTVTRQIEEQIRFLRDQCVSAERIDDWFSGLFDLVDGLYELPLRYPVAEAESALRGFEIRKLNYGSYILHYRVLERTRRVEVLSFRHGARRPTD